MSKIQDMTAALRSKNAGPFMITVDLFFANEADFDAVRDSNVLSVANVAIAYRVLESGVVGPFWHRDALMAKVTVPKHSSCQDVFCNDIFGSQQHFPIAQLEV
jgi:Domain of unknown function (DUF4387)